MHRMQMIAALVLPVFALAVLAGCGTEDPGGAPPNNTPVSQPADDQPAGADDFIKAIEKIDPALAEDPQKAINRAGNVCGYVGEDEAAQLKAVTDRWDGLSDADAKALLAAIKEHIC